MQKKIYLSALQALAQQERGPQRYCWKSGGTLKGNRVSGILGSHNISIKSMVQKEKKKEKAVPVVMMTHEAREKDMVRALKQINRLSIVSGRTMYLRVEGGGI